MANSNLGVQKAGDVEILDVKLITTANIVIDLIEFLAELNIYEDMFANSMHGNMMIVDARNLIEKGPIIGEEYLIVKVRTPSFTEVISKTFRVYRVSDRTIIRDNTMQSFILHFTSVELFNDVLIPLHVPFEGKIVDVVSAIYTNYIMEKRQYDVGVNEDTLNVKESVSPLIILGAIYNSVKFVSPGWTPFKCINWLASKSIPLFSTAKNFLFFESNKAFYFGSVEVILKNAHDKKNYIGNYTISASNIRNGEPVPDINREYFLAKDVSMAQTTDYIKNYTNGYLANRLITLDVHNKEYKNIDYDHVKNFKNQKHTSPNPKAIFSDNALRNSLTSVDFYPVNDYLFSKETKTGDKVTSTNFKENISTKMGEIHGNRKSSLLELSNLKLNMTVPGRTDIEVGRVLYFNYPILGEKESPDETSNDKYYSGYYLVTAIHHTINKSKHMMTMECVKDCLEV